MNQKKLNLILTIVAAVFAALFVALLVCGLVIDFTYTVTKIMMIVVALVSLALAAELAFLVWFGGKGDKPNYFLYDASTKKNVGAEKLTLQVVNRRMDRYFSEFAPSEGKLWTDGILEDPDLDMEDAFKPLVAYKLLIDLADRDVEKGWKCFEVASAATVEFVCSSLEMNGETEIAGNLRKMKAIVPFQVKYVRDYLVSNANYLQTKMLMYVRDNIEKFN
ncbi:MAG: hypothetical protein E7677_05715 [Ruminococcaceae bacterium]|nr:hypothetical protein [Oscillospiraceae bacterium]